MREWFGGAGFIVFSACGAALAVAWVFALLDRLPATSPDVRAGQMRQLRRYSVCWAGGLCLWAAGVALLSLLAARA